MIGPPQARKDTAIIHQNTPSIQDGTPDVSTVHVSVFQGSTNTTPVATLPLQAVLERIQEGRYRGFVQQLRRTRATKGDEAYDLAKRHSMAFTPAGTFTARNNASLETPSGCLNLDIDDLPALDHTRALLGADPYLLYMFLSPSGTGLKLGLHVSPYTDAATYRHAWLAVERYLAQTYPALAVSNDRACKDVARLCYMSWDPNLYCNTAAVPFPVPPPCPPAPKATPRTTPVHLSEDHRTRFAEQAIANAVTILDASVARTPTSNGTRDQQRLKASRLLGGYIAGGVLTEADATAGIAAAVERNTTNVARAWRVIARGLQYGAAVPISLMDLEAEYAHWTLTHTSRPSARSGAPSAQEHGAAPGPTIAPHVVPDHLQHHPDPRVRTHWARVYARANARKQQLLRDPYALALPAHPEGA